MVRAREGGHECVVLIAHPVGECECVVPIDHPVGECSMMSISMSNVYIPNAV